MELTIDQALQTGLAAQQKGDLQEAVRLYQIVLQIQPSHPNANHNLGQIATAENKTQAALSFFKSALEADPRVEQFWISYLNALISDSQFSTAKAVLAHGRQMGMSGQKFDVIESQLMPTAPPADSEKSKENQNTDGAGPSQSQLNNLLGLFQQGALAEAEALAITLTKEFPDHQFSWKVLAAIFGQSGRKSDALKAMEKAVELSPQDYESRINLSHMLREAGRFDEAVTSFEQATALNPNFAGAHNDLGMMLQQLGRFEEAATSYKQAIDLNLNFSDAHSNLAGTLRQMGKLEEAEYSCRKVVELEPDFALGHCDLGTVLRELGRLDEAETSFRQAISLEPSLARAHISLGSTLRELGRVHDAEVSYRQAIALAPGFAIAYSNLGVALKDLGRYEEAEENYRHAIALQPNFVDARYNLGTLLFEGKKYKEAAEQFEMVDLPQSKFYAIQCAYHLNEKSSFDEKLDSLITQGEVNAVVGLLSCCSDIKFGIKKSNPFCGEPLKYVVKNDLTEKYDFKGVFIDTAKEILSDSSMSYKDQVHLSNGVQTAGNFFTLDKVHRTEIESIIRSEIEKYRMRFKDSEEGFIKNWPASYNLVGWLVSMRSGGSLTAHIHDTGWITGSIYINIPSKAKADSGNIVLRMSDQEPALGAESSQESSIDLKTGNLCFFPSSLMHHTVPFEVEEHEENRIVLAFDVIPVTS